MKKFIVFALAATLCVAFCSCASIYKLTDVINTTVDIPETASITEAVTTTEVTTTEITTTEATTTEALIPQFQVKDISPDEFYKEFKGCWTNSNNEFWHFRESGGKPVMYLSVWDTDVFSGNGEIKKVSQTDFNTYKVYVHFPDYVDPRDERGTVLIPAYDKEFTIIRLFSDKIAVDGITYKFGRQLG